MAHARWVATLVGACAVGAGALAGCGEGARLHVETTFPVVPGAKIVGQENLSSMGPEIAQALIVVGPRGMDARDLARKERALVRKQGWRRHVTREHSGNVFVYWFGPPSDTVHFGPVNASRGRGASSTDLKLARSTPGAMRRKIYVELSPPEPQGG